MWHPQQFCYCNSTKIRCVVTIQKAYSRKPWPLMFLTTNICVWSFAHVKLQSQNLLHKNVLRGCGLLPTFLCCDNVMWSAGALTAGEGGKQNALRRLFWRSKMLRFVLSCDHSKFKTEELSPFWSHFRQELPAWSCPDLHSSAQDIMYLILKCNPSVRFVSEVELQVWWQEW